MWDTLWTGIHLATMLPGTARYGAVPDGAVGIVGDAIAWAGPEAALPGPPAALARELRHGGGRWMLPAFIDPHTHLVWGGDRADEWERRLEGATYEQIAREGGGIRATVRATRAAGEAELFASARRRLLELMAEGVATVEIKSGYGLDFETEARCLRVARRLGADLPVTVQTTFLGAHAVPPEYDGRSDAYADLVAAMVPQLAAAGLADAVDAFCEGIAFSPAQVARVFDAARACGLPVKLHAEQLSDTGGAGLAARYGALSADHLEHLSESGVCAMAASGTVAVLLPGAYLFLRETKAPPVALLRRHGVPIALATDCNPGSSPCTSPLLILQLACTLFRLTPEEALLGLTRNAARALGLDDRGVIAPGQRADLALWDIRTPAELCYRMGGNPCAGVVRGGTIYGPAAAG